MPPPILDKKTDPGWNDPPTLSYTTSNPPPRSRITNKRVAFPLSSNNPLPVSATSAPPYSEVNIQENDQENFDSEVALRQILINIETSAKDINNPSNVLEDKIKILETMWKENKLNKKIQKLVLDMSEYIVNGEMEKANECQLQLMITSAALCEPWLAGFRLLISK